ncbi:MAG: hypothetical protein V1889_01135 [archaeon]
MVKRSIWDWLAWIALGSLVVWLVLRGIGIINTPFLLEYYPYFVITYFFGYQIGKLNHIIYEVDGLKKFRNETIKKIHKIELNCIRNHGK